MLYKIYDRKFGGGNMKIVAKLIEVVSWIDIKGNINPVRFKITNEDWSRKAI